MAGEPLRAVVARADHVPGGLVETAVQSRQHDRARFGSGDRGDQFGRGAVRAGRARNDGRAAPRARFERIDFGLDEQRRAVGAVDEAVSLSHTGQWAKAILRKSSVMRQYLSYSSGASVSIRLQSTPSMIMSSISAARSAASA